MIAILLAAQLSMAAAVPAPVEFKVTNVTVRRAPNAVFGKTFVQPQVLCPPSGTTNASNGDRSLMRPQDWKNLHPRTLADLPKANLEVAVARTVGGCAVPVGIRYSVEGDGTFATDPRP